MNKKTLKILFFRFFALLVGTSLAFLFIFLVDKTIGIFSSDLWSLSRRKVSQFQFSISNPYPRLESEIQNSLSLEPLAKVTHMNRYEKMEVVPYDVKTETILQSGKSRIRKAYRQKGTYQNNQIYDVQITELDGRRLSFDLSRPPVRPEHLFVFGCSFVFGDGLNDSETLPWILNSKQTRFTAYNLGKSGWGPNDLLSFTLKNELLPIDAPKNGAAFYLYRDHIDRALNSLQVAGNWGGNNEAVMETDRAFISLGKFSEAHPIRHLLYRFLYQMNLVHLLGVNWPIYSESNVKYVARMIHALQKEYNNQTNEKNPFYVVFYPMRMPEDIQLQLRTALNELGVQFLDYSVIDLQMIMNDPATIPFDGHPNRMANEKFADLLIRDLPIFSKEK